jgi:hypothetical protein
MSEPLLLDGPPLLLPEGPPLLLLDELPPLPLLLDDPLPPPDELPLLAPDEPPLDDPPSPSPNGELATLPPHAEAATAKTSGDESNARCERERFMRVLRGTTPRRPRGLGGG